MNCLEKKGVAWRGVRRVWLAVLRSATNQHSDRRRRTVVRFDEALADFYWIRPEFLADRVHELRNYGVNLFFKRGRTSCAVVAIAFSFMEMPRRRSVSLLLLLLLLLLLRRDAQSLKALQRLRRHCVRLRADDDGRRRVRRRLHHGHRCDDGLLLLAGVVQSCGRFHQKK